MSSTQDIGAWLHRARSGVTAAQSTGILPTRAARAGDGSLVAPSFAPWVPWIPIALITVIAGAAGLAPDGGVGGGVPGAVVAAAAGAAMGAAPYLLHRVTHVGFASLGALIVAGMMAPAAGPVLAAAGMLWFVPARMYHRAAYDAEAIRRAGEAAAWVADGARAYLIVEVIDPARTDGAKLRLLPAGGAVPLTRIVRALPGDCGPEALIVLDDSATCLVTLPADLHERFRHLEETVR